MCYKCNYNWFVNRYITGSEDLPTPLSCTDCGCALKITHELNNCTIGVLNVLCLTGLIH